MEKNEDKKKAEAVSFFPYRFVKKEKKSWIFFLFSMLESGTELRAKFNAGIPLWGCLHFKILPYQTRYQRTPLDFFFGKNEMSGQQAGGGGSCMYIYLTDTERNVFTSNG